MGRCTKPMGARGSAAPFINIHLTHRNRTRRTLSPSLCVRFRLTRVSSDDNFAIHARVAWYWYAASTDDTEVNFWLAAGRKGAGVDVLSRWIAIVKNSKYAFCRQYKSQCIRNIINLNSNKFVVFIYINAFRSSTKYFTPRPPANKKINESSFWTRLIGQQVMRRNFTYS